jgi:hypothetical protein
MWSLDRRVAAAAFLGAALALAGTIATSDAPAPTKPGTDRVELARELVAVANRGARASWLVTYRFTRITATRNRLHDTIVVAHVRSTDRSPLDIDDGLGSFVVTAGARTYSCTVPRDVPECLERAASERTARPGDVYGGAVVSGRYDIERLPSLHIAGLAARCFELRLRTGAPVPGIGFRSEQCYSNAGVPLRSLVQGPTATDVRVAIIVRRPVGRAELLPLLSPYGLERLAPEQ